MPLDNASDAPPTDADPFSSSDDDQFSSSSNKYPPFSSLAIFSNLLGYTESDRARYIRAQVENTERLLNFNLTADERAGLAYYDSIFYTYESYGDLLGTTTGIAIGNALRNRPTGFIVRGLSRMLGQSANPRATRYIGTALKMLAFGAAGRIYGLTTAGIQALNRMRSEQSKDPIMERVVQVRAAKAASMLGRKMPQRRALPAQEEDAQSLGGMEIADQARLGDEAAAREMNRSFPFGKPSEKVIEMEQRRERPEDPFGMEEATGGQEEAQRGDWRNKNSSTTESTWERLRRGQTAGGGGGGGRGDGGGEGEGLQRTSPWPARAPMKGFDNIAASEPKTDSFSFSNTAEERELAKAQAQKEFDESVEKERRSGSGDGYSEGDNGGRRWKD